MDTITETELREVFKCTHLWRLGWTFERAINTEVVLRGMRNQVLANRKRIERNTGNPAPIQQALI